LSIFCRQIFPVGCQLELEASPVTLRRFGLGVVEGLTPEPEVGVVIANPAAHFSPAPLAPLDAGLVPIAA